MPNTKHKPASAEVAFCGVHPNGTLLLDSFAWTPARAWELIATLGGKEHEGFYNELAAAEAGYRVVDCSVRVGRTFFPAPKPRRVR